MKPFNEVKISIYRNVRDRIGAVTTLDAFLRSEKHRAVIEKLRSVDDKDQRKELKKLLPCATVSGLFGQPRKADNLIAHSGYLCIDIDADDNPSLGDLSIVRKILENRPEVAYAGRSVSGRGWFAVVPLVYPEKHLEQFLAIEQEYARLGIVLDNSCKDVSRLRFVSFDDHAYFNPSPVPYDKVYVEPSAATYARTPFPVSGGDRELRNVTRCCEIIEQYHMDITDGYKDWFALACSLSSLGEEGRPFFHLISRQSSKYRPNECDSKFTEALQTRGRYPQHCGLGTFFWICKDYGITYKS